MQESNIEPPVYKLCPFSWYDGGMFRCRGLECVAAVRCYSVFDENKEKPLDLCRLCDPQVDPQLWRMGR